MKNETEEQVKSPSEQLNCNGEKKDWAEQSAEKPLELSDAAGQARPEKNPELLPETPTPLVCGSIRITLVSSASFLSSGGVGGIFRLALALGLALTPFATLATLATLGSGSKRW